MSLHIFPPVSPHRGMRGTDSWGSGNFGASRDGGARQHTGLDFITVPGDAIVSPITGRCTHVGKAYADADLGSIHLLGDGDFLGWLVKLLYVAPDPDLVGRVFSQGHRIGEAQDVTGYWKAKRPDHVGDMRNHIHMEIKVTEPRFVDPAHYLPEGLTVPPAGVRA